MRKTTLKFGLCAAGISLAMIYFGTQRTDRIQALFDKDCRGKSAVSSVNARGQDNKSVDKLYDVKRHQEELRRAKLPTDYFERDYIEDNELVDKLVPLLKSNIDVIEEIQRIQYNMFKNIIGKFKFAMLFNFAAFENKGDPAITVGELHIIKKLGIELVFHCEVSCGKNSLEGARNISKRYNTENLVILMQGGGNLLCYIFEDYNRKMVLETFPDFNIVLFPQSLWQHTTPEITKVFQTVYSKHKHLTFLYRDRNSYNLGKQLFPEVQCYLMPDMAFQIGKVQRFIVPTHDIMWIKRSDPESMQYKIPTSMLAGKDVIVQDWWGWKTPRTNNKLEDPIMMAANGMMFLQRGRVVITDRLHGHILSVLCGIPHVVLDPVNRKITSFMQSWTGGIDNIFVAHSAEDAANKALQLLSILENKLPETLSFRK